MNMWDDPWYNICLRLLYKHIGLKLIAVDIHTANSTSLFSYSLLTTNVVSIVVDIHTANSTALFIYSLLTTNY